MQTSLPHVALVGRPNAGKSTLFNRLIRKRVAVVADVAGTTRDRLEYPLTWLGRPFILTDMAGLEPALANDTEIRQGTQAQIGKALQDSDILVWVVDASQGVSQADQAIAVQLRALHKPVIVLANKCDHPRHDLAQYEFSQFGFEELIPASAIHGRGVEQLLDVIVDYLPGDAEAVPEIPEDKELRVSIVGRPNVGKSTLLNTLVEEERAVVSPEAGTTRDSVDTVIPAARLFFNTYTKWRSVRLVDTAGIRQRGKIGHSVEAWSVLRSMDAIDRGEVTLLIVDATEGLVHQDLQVAEQVVQAGKPLVLLLNKWDLVLEKKNVFPGTLEDSREQERVLDAMRQQVPFLHWVQVLFLSAKERINIQIIGRLVLNAYNAWNLKVEPEDLRSFTLEMAKQPRFKNLQGITYEHARPPVFHIHVEGRALPHFSSNRLMENALRQYFEIGPTPIKIWSVSSVPKHRRK